MDSKQAKAGKGNRVPKEKPDNAKKMASQRADLTFSIPKSNFSDWYEELMVTAGIVDKHWDIKGMPIFLPYGYTMHNNIMHLFEDEYANIGIKQCQFPAYIPRSFLEKEADHVKGFQSECFWHEDSMCLRPTSETAMYSMFSLWVKSLDDLPLMVHQSCNVYRYETKNTKPLIRVREIPWNEAHTVHETPEEAKELLESCWQIVHRVLTERLSIDGLRLRRPDWDRFPGAEFTDVLDVVMPCGRVLQTIGAHYLGTHFSKVFDIQVNGEHRYMTCIGVSTRALAAVLSMHGDDKGLIVPTDIAPTQVVIVPMISDYMEDPYFTILPNGSVDPSCKAVTNGFIILNSDGSVNPESPITIPGFIRLTPEGVIDQTCPAFTSGFVVLNAEQKVDPECPALSCSFISLLPTGAINPEAPLVKQSHIQLVDGVIPKNNKAVQKAKEYLMQIKVKELEQELKNAGFRVSVDRDTSKRPGEKFYFYEMKGIPLRIEFGARDYDNNECVLVVRGIEGKFTLKLNNIVEECRNYLGQYDSALKQRAQAHLKSRIVDASSVEEIGAILEQGGFARIPYHTMTKDGAEGVQYIHERCGGEIRGYRPLEQQPGEGIKCIITGKPAKFWAYVARSY